MNPGPDTCFHPAVGTGFRTGVFVRGLSKAFNWSPLLWALAILGAIVLTHYALFGVKGQMALTRVAAVDGWWIDQTPGVRPT